jgi:hypothetical protein
LFKHYTYQYGGDCNNIYKDIGTVEIRTDSLVLQTHFTQKAHAPIPEWEKKIYTVKQSGKIVLLSNNIFQNGVWNAVQ